MERKHIVVLVIIIAFGIIPPVTFLLIPASQDFVDSTMIPLNLASNSFEITSLTSFNSSDSSFIIGTSQGFLRYIPSIAAVDYLVPENNFSRNVYSMTSWVNENSILAVTNVSPIDIMRIESDGTITNLFSIEHEFHTNPDCFISAGYSRIVYVALRTNLYCYNIESEVITTANTSSIIHQWIDSLSTDDDNAIIGSFNGFGIFEPTSNVTISELDDIFTSRQAVAYDQKNNISYVGTKRGLFIYSMEHGEIFETDWLTEHQGLPGRNVLSLHLDHASRRLYIGTSKGVVAYDTENHRLFKRFVQIESPSYLHLSYNLLGIATEEEFRIVDASYLEPSETNAMIVFFRENYLPIYSAIISVLALFQIFSKEKKE